MNTSIPSYLTSGKNTAWLVSGTALFAILFILIFKPFDSYAWANSNFWLFAGYTLMAVISGMATIAASRTTMYFFSLKRNIALVRYLIWILIELSVMAVIFTIQAILFGKENHWQDFGNLFEKALLYSTLILLIPYSIFTLGFILKDKSEQLHRLQNVTEGKNSALKTQDELLNFKDDKGELKLSIRQSALFYIESADNYIIVHFLNAGKMHKYLLRNSLKRIENDFQDKDLVRCHRSYIVNFRKIQLLQRTDDGLIIDFGEERIKALPVSKTYSQNLLLRFTDEAQDNS